MPVGINNQRGQRSEARSHLEKLARTMRLRPKGAENQDGVLLIDPNFVFNPHPQEFMTAWCRPDKYQRKKIEYGAKVVPVDRAIQVYKIHEGDDGIDRGKNCVRRNGCILIEYPRMGYEVRMAEGPYKHLAAHAAAINKFAEEIGDGFREVNESGSAVLAGPTPNRKNIRMNVDKIRELKEREARAAAAQTGKITQREWGERVEAQYAEQAEAVATTADGAQIIDGVPQIGGTGYLEPPDEDFTEEDES